MRRDRRPAVVAVAGLLLSLAVFSGLYDQERRSALTAMQIAANESLAMAISQSEASFHAVQRLGRHQEADRDMTWEEWANDATLLVHEIPPLKNLVWRSADQSEYWTADAGGSQKILGDEKGRLANAPGAWAATSHALPKSSGPRTLLHDSSGFYYEVPMMLKGGTPAGILRAMFLYREMLAPVFWDYADIYGVRINVGGRTVYDDRLHAGRIDVTASRRVLGETWEFAFSPLGPLVPARQLALAATASILIALLGLMLAAAFHFRARAAHRAMQATEARNLMKSAIEALSSPFAFFDADDHLVYWNDAFQELHGAIAIRTRVGVTYSELVRASIEAGHIREAKGREEEFYENRMELHKGPGFVMERELTDGRWRQTTEQRLPNGSTVTLITDISSQKQREAELKAQRDRLSDMREQLKAEQQKFQSFAEASADWFWITDANHVYTWISDNLSEHMPAAPAELIGRTRVDGDKSIRDFPRRDEHMQQLAQREPFRDVLVRWSDQGNEHWVRSSGIPQFDDNGNFTGYFGSGRDITELWRAERRYEAIRDQLSNALGSISEGLMLFDSKDRLVLCNENFREHNPGMENAMQPGSRYADIIELAARTVLPEEITEEGRRSWLKRRMNLRDMDDPVMEFQNRNGDWCRIAEHRTSDGSTIMIRTDITDLKERQIELEIERNNAHAANRAKTDFLTNMSHELRTPLNAIIGFADVMATGIYGPLEQRYASYAEDIGDSGRHLLSLINDLLDGARIESGKYTLDIEELSLDHEIRKVESLMQPILEDRQLETRHGGIIGDGITIRADQRAFKQILLNLLSNAAKFSHDEGRIVVIANARGEDLELQVRDNGIGLSGEDLERVFERFVQVQDPMHRSHDGTGIGLPLSRSLAELQGGSLHLEQGEKGGVTAVLRLPGAAVQAEPESMRSIA